MPIRRAEVVGVHVYVDGVLIDRLADPSFELVKLSHVGTAREVGEMLGSGGPREDGNRPDRYDNVVNFKKCSVCRKSGHNKTTCPELG